MLSSVESLFSIMDKYEKDKTEGQEGFKRYDNLMAKLGKHNTGKSCLYINKLEDVDIQVLRELISESYN